jgi:hypothetical protein
MPFGNSLRIFRPRAKNQDHLPVDKIAAELSNHLIPDVVLTPGAVATLVNLQQAGFAYSR